MRGRLLVASVAAVACGVSASWASATSGGVRFARPTLVADMPSGWTEPRVATGRDGTLWTVTNDPNTGDATVFSSRDGRHWNRTRTTPPGQKSASTDVDLVVTRTGRVIVTELDDSGIRFVTDYTDDRGRTWKTSLGTSYPDTDRPWLAVGPDDKGTHQPRVYLLFHNLLTGSAVHEMYVATSTDGGASFGPPVPVALPGSQAYLDLQCADSGAPSAIVVNQRTGRVFAVFGTRSSIAGGCGASATGTFEINVVGETRIWVASSLDGSPGSWTDTLAYDAAPDVVSASFETAAIDAGGTAYISFAQTAHAYPDFSRAAVRYVFLRPESSHWSAPVTVEPGGRVGTYDPTVVGGAANQIAVAYVEGAPASGAPVWSMRYAVVAHATSHRPQITRGVIDPRPAYAESADDMGGSCATGPLAGAENGLLCDRASDDFGITLDRHCRLVVVYPMTANRARGSDGGTWAAVQDGGPTICRRTA